MPCYELRLIKRWGEDWQEMKIETLTIITTISQGETCAEESEFINKVSPKEWRKMGDERFREVWSKDLTTGNVLRYALMDTDLWEAEDDGEESMNEEWDNQTKKLK